MNLQEVFAQLGLPVDADERAVRRAYARLLKDIDQLAQPQEFIALRSAYEQAMAYARGEAELDVWSEHVETQPSPPEPLQMMDQPEIAQSDEEPEARPDSSADSDPASNAEYEPEQEPEPVPEPEAKAERLVTNAMAVAEQLLDAWNWQFAAADMEAAKEELQRLLASPELESIENREAFVMALAQRIAGKTLGVRRSALLVAADSLFAWQRNGINNEVLEYILDAFQTLKTKQRQVAIALLGAPDPKVAQALRLTPENLELFEEQWRHLLNWWLPEGQLQNWMSQWAQLPMHTRAADGIHQLAKQWKPRAKAYLTHFGLIAVILVAALLFFNWFAGRTHGSQQAKSDMECAQTLAGGRANSWQAVPANDLWKYSSCITNPRVATKVDKRGLEQAKRIARVLTGVGHQLGGGSFSSRLSHLYLNMPDGRAFGFVRPESPVRYCAELRSFALRNQWLQVGDVLSAKAFVQELAWCTTQKSPRDRDATQGLMAKDKLAINDLERDYSTVFWNLLSHVDAWPDAKKPLLSLQQLVNEAKLPDYDWRLPPELGADALECAHDSSLIPCQRPDSSLSTLQERAEERRRQGNAQLKELDTHQLKLP
ncbi:molecular chaperone DnaJ [Comamonas sp. MYb396]|uniref:molecular chaperone DnaJ n=1 Tax=Comamonas sp. MYb396 TaxID=2745302 RepID=UPI0030A6636E